MAGIHPERIADYQGAHPVFKSGIQSFKLIIGSYCLPVCQMTNGIAAIFQFGDAVADMPLHCTAQYFFDSHNVCFARCLFEQVKNLSHTFFQYSGRKA